MKPNTMIEICYKKNPIREAVVRIDFLTPVLQFNTEIPAEIILVIKEIFPIPEPREVVARELQISKEGVKQNENTIKEWHFHNKERNRRLIVTKDYITMVQTHYETYAIFKDDFFTIVDSFFQTIDIQIKRFGIRFVNQIDFDKGDPYNWSVYINKNLLSIFNIPENKGTIARAFHNLELNFSEYNLRFQYGMHNPDFPAPIKKKTFILDFDAYTNGILNKRDLDSYFPQFHDSIQNLFENSITEKYRKILNNE